MSPRTEKDRFRPNLISLSLAIPFDIPSIDSIDNYILLLDYLTQIIVPVT